VAELIKRLKAFLQTPAGQILAAVVYAAMLLLVLMFFTGNGQFIYEAF
jgi:hypothetical protein